MPQGLAHYPPEAQSLYRRSLASRGEAIPHLSRSRPTPKDDLARFLGGRSCGYAGRFAGDRGPRLSPKILSGPEAAHPGCLKATHASVALHRLPLACKSSISILPVPVLASKAGV